MPRDGVGKFLVIFDGGHGHQEFRGEFLAQLHVFLEGSPDVPREGLDGDPVLGEGRQIFDEHLKIVLAGNVVSYFRLPFSLHENFHRSIGHPHHLNDRAESAHAVDVLRLGVVLLGIFLRGHHDELIFVHRLLDGVYGLLSADEEGCHHRREYHHIP